MLKINTSLPGFDRQVELARPWRLDSRTIIRLQNEFAAARRERDIAVSEATVHRLERDLERHISATYLAERDTLKAERDSVKDALERYNPEVINRQEELRNIDAQLQRETDVEKLHRPALSCPLRGDPLTRMRQGLTYLGYQQFWDWLTTRPEIEAADQDAPYAGHVNASRALPNFSEEANRVCKSRPLFVDMLAFWRQEPADQHYGVFICPDYKYDPVKRIWVRTDGTYECGEQTREVFYAQGGKTYYSGTYMCHTGPAHLRVHHLGALGNENLLQSIASTTHGGGKRHGDEKQAISELYREGTLTVRVIGLERIGFNQQLHRKLVAQCRRREGQKAHRRREKRGIWTGPPLPTPVIPRPVSVAIAPLPPPSCGFGMKRGREEYEDEDEYEDDEDDQQPWKVQKVEYEEEDKEWPLAEERCEREGQDYQQDGDYEEDEHYEDEENGSSLKFEEYAYYY